MIYHEISSRNQELLLIQWGVNLILTFIFSINLLPQAYLYWSFILLVIPLLIINIVIANILKNHTLSWTTWIGSIGFSLLIFTIIPYVNSLISGIGGALSLVVTVITSQQIGLIQRPKKSRQKRRKRKKYQ